MIKKILHKLKNKLEKFLKRIQKQFFFSFFLSIFLPSFPLLTSTRIPILYSTIFVVCIVNFAETPECGEPEKPIYGVVKVRGEAAHYNCIPGYIRSGNSTRTCTWSGWRPVPGPECIGNYLLNYFFFLSKILLRMCFNI